MSFIDKIKKGIEDIGDMLKPALAKAGIPVLALPQAGTHDTIQMGASDAPNAPKQGATYTQTFGPTITPQRSFDMATSTSRMFGFGTSPKPQASPAFAFDTEDLASSGVNWDVSKLDKLPKIARTGQRLGFTYDPLERTLNGKTVPTLAIPTQPVNPFQNIGVQLSNWWNSLKVGSYKGFEIRDLALSYFVPFIPLMAAGGIAAAVEAVTGKSVEGWLDEAGKALEKAME